MMENISNLLVIGGWLYSIILEIK